jgi:hypothetical protein
MAAVEAVSALAIVGVPAKAARVSRPPSVVETRCEDFIFEMFPPHRAT